MRSISLIAPAKINLYLEIIGDRPDGYHELAMVMQTVDLADRVDVRANGTDDFRIHSDNPQVPQDKTNLAHRAAELMKAQFPDKFAKYGGADITLHKHIPVAAGLAGGSSNAAAVLVGLDLIWEVGLTQSELQDLGSGLGSDVPFCISGGTALATGRGDKLAPLPDLDRIFVVLAKYRSIEVSTAWAYKSYRQQFGHAYVSDRESLEDRRQRVHSGPMVSAIAHRNAVEIGQRLHNDLELVVLPAHPPVAHLREVFNQQSGVLGVMMSGSGPTVFAIAESQDIAQKLVSHMKGAIADPSLDLWVAKCTNTGVRVMH